MADRLILNSKLGTAVTGIYSVGAMISMVVEVAAYSVNRAYFPLSMSALKSRDPAQLTRLRAMGSLVVAGFCLLGTAVAAFGPELVRLMTARAFAGAALVIPVLVFGGVASAIYYLLVNILFFDRNGVKWLPICTLTAAILNVSLALLLIPRFNLIGAAVATLLGQVLATALVAAIGRRFDPVAWDYGPYSGAFVSSLGFALWLSRLTEAGALVTCALKIAGLAGTTVLLGFVLWRRPLILADAAVRLLRRRPEQAVALFMNVEVAS
jgi:O-antigen/teichoic acid export membrane protein